MSKKPIIVFEGIEGTGKTHHINNIAKYLKVSVTYNGPIQAPVKKDDILGKLKVTYKNELIEEYNLFAIEDVKKLNVFSRIVKSINFLIWGDV